MKRYIQYLLVFLVIGIPSAQAAFVNWTDWRGVTQDGVYGQIGINDIMYTGSYSFFQTGTGINYWTEGEPAPYTGNSVIDNAPTPAEMLALDSAGTHELEFENYILNPVMAIVSLGRSSLPVSYDFDTDFTVLSEGRGYWGDGSYTLDDVNDILTGYELHAAIQFNGLINKISWTSSPNEYWHGITIGELTTSVPESSTLLLMGIGLAGLGFVRLRKQS